MRFSLRTLDFQRDLSIAKYEQMCQSANFDSIYICDRISTVSSD
jgi:hypothetical protein